MAPNTSDTQTADTDTDTADTDTDTADTHAIEVLDQGTLLRFTFDDLLRYAGPGSPGGVAMAFAAMRAAFPLLDSDQPVQRREVLIETAFRGPGGRDGFEHVTRGLTDGRYLVTDALEHPERGMALEQFVFRFLYRTRECTLLVRAGVVTDDFVNMARKSDRTTDEERQFTAMKQGLADLLLAGQPEAFFEISCGDRDPGA
ncbi:MAG: hypothetical protein QOF81_1470 [Acidimicrobiaceae bacterium]|nr:hypothetical protein [Acidimicrobiaceae bacterium]